MIKFVQISMFYHNRSWSTDHFLRVLWLQIEWNLESGSRSRNPDPGVQTETGSDPMDDLVLDPKLWLNVGRDHTSPSPFLLLSGSLQNIANNLKL